MRNSLWGRTRSILMETMCITMLHWFAIYYSAFKCTLASMYVLYPQVYFNFSSWLFFLNEGHGYWHHGSPMKHQSIKELCEWKGELPRYTWTKKSKQYAFPLWFPPKSQQSLLSHCIKLFLKYSYAKSKSYRSPYKIYSLKAFIYPAVNLDKASEKLPSLRCHQRAIQIFLSTNQIYSVVSLKYPAYIQRNLITNR